MSHINILIVDDDINKVSLLIKTVKEVYSGTLLIGTATCVQEAIENLQKLEYHLLITDLQMPLKYDSVPDNNGGQSLVRALYRKKSNLHVPLYVIGLTQFEELKNDLKGVWKVWNYDSSSEDWKISLRELIFHISLIKYRIQSHPIETVFVEGPTDKKLIEYSLKSFYPNYEGKVFIDTINFGGGASWVERQLIIWAKSLKKNENGYLKSIGLFDCDEAGNKAVKRIKTAIDPNSSEAKTFSIISTTYKYSPLLKSINKKGIQFEYEIEDFVSKECWELAKKNGWLESRSSKKIFVNDSILKINSIDINESSLLKAGFTNDESLIICNKIADDYKKVFANYACSGNPDFVKNVSYIFKEILFKLKLYQESSHILIE